METKDLDTSVSREQAVRDALSAGLTLHCGPWWFTQWNMGCDYDGCCDNDFSDIEDAVETACSYIDDCTEEPWVTE